MHFSHMFCYVFKMHRLLCRHKTHIAQFFNKFFSFSSFEVKTIFYAYVLMQKIVKNNEMTIKLIKIISLVFYFVNKKWVNTCNCTISIMKIFHPYWCDVMWYEWKRIGKFQFSFNKNRINFPFSLFWQCCALM